MKKLLFILLFQLFMIFGCVTNDSNTTYDTKRIYDDKGYYTGKIVDRGYGYRMYDDKGNFLGVIDKQNEKTHE